MVSLYPSFHRSLVPWAYQAKAGFNASLPHGRNRTQERSGKTYLVYSSYPNGAPVDNIKHKEAKDAIQSDMPGVQIDPRHLVFGRVKVNGRDTGAVVYPIADEDFRIIENTLESNKSDPFRAREEIDNKIIPKIIQKDMAKSKGETVIYDMTRGRTLTSDEVAQYSKNAGGKDGQPSSPQITTSRGKAMQTGGGTVAPAPTTPVPPSVPIQNPAGGYTTLPGQVSRPPIPVVYTAPQASTNNPFARSMPASYAVPPPRAFPFNQSPYPMPASMKPAANPSASMLEYQRPGEGNDYFVPAIPWLKPLAPGQHAPPFPGVKPYRHA